MTRNASAVRSLPVDCLTAARAEALFTSDLSATSRPTPAQVDGAIQAAVRKYGGTRGCAAQMAAAFGDYPEMAAPRMRWARAVVESAYAQPARVAAGLGSTPTPRRPVSLEMSASGRT
jgi:type IV secretory pathway TrbL component